MQIKISCYNKFTKFSGSNRTEGIKFTKKTEKSLEKKWDEGERQTLKIGIFE